MKRENIISLFKEKNFRATPQRIAVYEYVYENRNHPDVLAVYENVKRNILLFQKQLFTMRLKLLRKTALSFLLRLMMSVFAMMQIQGFMVILFAIYAGKFMILKPPSQR